MKRRVLCVLLSALILISFIPNGVIAVRAYENLTASDACVEILKQMEGFLKYPVYDNGQYSIGYGSGCNPGDYPNGITEEKAEELLRNYIIMFERSVNSLAQRYNLTFTQYEFDALVLFTYNVGGNWVNSDGEFRQVVINGVRGNDFIYPFCLWSSSGGEMNIHLVRRRLIEANMYLNGSYANLVPASYTYVVYENNGGIGDVKVQGYDSNLPASVKPIPTLTGNRFLGWYTEDVGGSWVTNLTAANGATTLYAHWQSGNGDMVNGTKANYQRSSNQLGSQSVYDAPGGKAVGTVESGTSMKIVADYVDGSNIKWGKREDGTWVNLGNPLIGVVSSASVGEEVTVTGGAVNVRSGPGTTYNIVGGVTKGDKITITETRMNGTDVWGKFEKGWICLRYTTYVHTPQEETPDIDDNTAAIIATGVVVDCDALRVRSGPGTNYPMVTAVNAGTRVQFTQIRTVNGAKWGKINSGWISLAYVKMDDTIVQPDQDTPPDDSGSSGSVTGTVSANGGLNIRSDAGTQNAIVGYYAPGTIVTILEQKTVNGTAWGRTDKGWVSMAYIKLGAVGTTPETTPAETVPEETVPEETKPEETKPEETKPEETKPEETKPEDTPPETTPDETVPESDPEEKPAGITGTVTTGLNVRAGAGTHYGIVNGYKAGDKVTILEQKTVNGMNWGRTDRGWIALAYVKLDSAGGAGTPEPEKKPENDPTTQTQAGNGVVISNSPLNIRKAPGTHNAQIGAYPRGTRITILQQTTVNGVVWGQTDKGWVCMQYVQLDSAANANYNATVTASSLAIRDKAGLDSTVLGFYNNGANVKILESTFVGGVEWGRTDKGWICLAYVQK